MPSPTSNPWFAQLEDMEDPMLLHEFVGDCLVDYPPEEIAALMNDQELQCALSTGSECNSSNAPGEVSDNSAKRQKPNGYPCSPNYISNSNVESDQGYPAQEHRSSSPEEIDTNPAPASTAKVTKRPRRLPDQCQNHIIAERQRRQTLSQLFIALSALIPGLKKMDKTSVLGEAITHMKQLKERLKVLEEENDRRSVESVVVVQRSRVLVENDSNSSTCNESLEAALSQDEQFPEIEARFSNKCVLVKIHCYMRVGLLSKIINEVENLNLSVTNTTSMPFNNRTVDITILAQMEMAFNVRPQEVVAKLRSIF